MYLYMGYMKVYKDQWKRNSKGQQQLIVLAKEQSTTHQGQIEVRAHRTAAHT